MPLYSFVVCNESGDVVTFSEYCLALDNGTNVFNCCVKNIDEFLALLAESGIRVEQMNRLDEDIVVGDELPKLGE